MLEIVVVFVVFIFGVMVGAKNYETERETAYKCMTQLQTASTASDTLNIALDNKDCQWYIERVRGKHTPEKEPA